MCANVVADLQLILGGLKEFILHKRRCGQKDNVVICKSTMLLGAAALVRACVTVVVINLQP
jgi:hypothetical protein